MPAVDLLWLFREQGYTSGRLFDDDDSNHTPAGAALLGIFAGVTRHAVDLPRVLTPFGGGAIKYWSMKARGLLGVVVVSLVVLLRPMAFASPPDQSWLGGFFDDADYDDVILVITGATPATVTTHVGYDPRPAQVVVMPVAEADETSVPALFVSAHHIRAPPSL